MPTTLVTGASGFAGGHLLDRIAGDRLVGWHRPGRTSPSSPANVTWQAVDLLDAATVSAHVADLRPTRIYHVAGASRLDTSWTDVVPHLRANVLGTHHVLEAVRCAGITCRVLVVSSAMVYRVEDSPLSEDAPLVPSSPYGLSKMAQDQLALQSCRDDGLDVVVARPFNHVGPRQSPVFSVPSFARQIAMIEAGRAEPTIKVGNLDARRDLSDVRDVVGAYCRLMESGSAGRPYNVCSGVAVRIGDVLNELIGLARVPVDVVQDPDRLRPSDTPRLVGDNARIRAEIGWSPAYSLTETLRDTLDWWRAEVG